MKVKSLAELNNQVKDESITLSNAGFTATLQSGTLSGNVVHTLPSTSSNLAPLASPSFTGTPTVNGVSFSGYSGFKNYIINGNFDVWQRGTIFNIPAGEFAFIADRFFVVNTSNQTVTAEKGIIAEGINGRRVNRLRISYATAPTSGAVQIAQKIEDVTRIVGSNTSSVYIATNESITITQDITQNFGSGGSSSVITSGSSFQSNSQITRFSSIYSIPTTANKTIGDSNYTQLTYALPIRTTNAVTFTLLQLEEGSVATPFENRPYGLELSLCQRYFFSSGGGLWENLGVGVASSTSADIMCLLPTPMRTPPTFTYSGTLSNYQLADGTSTYVPTNIVLQDSPYSTSCNVRVYATLVASRAIRLLSNNSAATRLNFSAEL